MDFSNLTHDEFADVGADFFAELEARVAAEEHDKKEEMIHLVAVAHRQVNRVRNIAVGSGHIQPFSGGVPKPE